MTLGYMIAMGLFFAESHDEVMRRMVGNLRKLGSWVEDWQVPSKSAITQAHQRLGPQPVKALFERECVPLATPVKVERFGKAGSGPKASA